jgi:hypothetical protein
MERVLSNAKEVGTAFSQYQATLNKVAERRKLWASETKNEIIETLTLVANTFQFRWRVQKIEQVENYQTINICLDQQKDGIETSVGSGGNPTRKSLIKHGGYLAYAQSHNGKINVFIGFPYIEDWVLPMDIKVIATVEPKEINEDLIISHVIKFLGVMEEWEGKDRGALGFKL